jgi:ABC-type multidrug transport system ATPase subunit
VQDAIVSIEGLTKSYSLRKYVRRLIKGGAQQGAAPDVLKGINLEIRKGEVLGLLGPNGAGKTTLLEILSTLLLPTSGRATVGGFDVVKEAGKVRRLVSYCASGTDTFYPRLSAARNLEFFASLNDLPPWQAAERMKTVMAQAGLEENNRAPFQHYSEGMKQRLALARALLKDPALLLLDEPTRSLDPLRQGEIRRLLRGLLVDQLGKTVLLVTHSLEEAKQVCDRLAILHRGKIVTVGTLEEVKSRMGGLDLAGAFEKAVMSDE